MLLSAVPNNKSYLPKFSWFSSSVYLFLLTLCPINSSNLVEIKTGILLTVLHLKTPAVFPSKARIDKKKLGGRVLQFLHPSLLQSPLLTWVTLCFQRSIRIVTFQVFFLALPTALYLLRGLTPINHSC